MARTNRRWTDCKLGIDRHRRAGDPMIGAQDGSYDITIPKRPIRRKIKGLPAFTTVKGGGYFFLPGIKALHYLAALDG
jgi:hypothetical protein